MELLWTDQCFLSMLIVGFLLLVNGLRKVPARRAMRRLLEQPLALCSGIVLLFFLIIGALDSLHMKADINVKNPEASVSDIVSVLDNILAPLGQMYEKTYSAPLALTLYSTEIASVDGKTVQRHPRLQYPPETIKNEADKQAVIWLMVTQAFCISMLSVLAAGLGIIGVRWVRFYRSKELEDADKTSHLRKQSLLNSGVIWGLLTVLLCLFCLLASFKLSRSFHLFGTGKIGQDIFYYAVKSIRTGLIIGTLTTLFMLPIAIILGITSGYFGGIIDDIIQYIYTTLSSIPGVLLITASVLSMQTFIANHPEQFSTLEKSADARLLALCLILGVTSWTSLCRLLRAEALKFREVDFVLAAKALGSSATYIIRKHLLPNVMSIVLITLVLDFSFLVLAEAVLSYVGVGVSPMTISWGNMINGARLELAREPIVWWPMMAAFVFMFVLVLASNVFADAVRDVFDPKNSQN